MNAQDIRSVAVIGAGLMGHGIAIEFARAGYDVRLHSRSEESLDRARGMIQDSLERLEDLGNISKQEAESVPDRVRMSTDLGEVVKDADLVIESIYEDLDAKTEAVRPARRALLRPDDSRQQHVQLLAQQARRGDDTTGEGHQRALSESAISRAARRSGADGRDLRGNDQSRDGTSDLARQAADLGGA